ncbi:unnamed protein product, partial [Dicrocoelium dendriticum]
MCNFMRLDYLRPIYVIPCAPGNNRDVRGRVRLQFRWDPIDQHTDKSSPRFTLALECSNYGQRLGAIHPIIPLSTRLLHFLRPDLTAEFLFMPTLMTRLTNMMFEGTKAGEMPFA